MWDSQRQSDFNSPKFQLDTIQFNAAVPEMDASDSNLHFSELDQVESKREWISTFNTSLLTTRAGSLKDRSAELGELMESPELECLLWAAERLAQTQNLSKEEATERMIDTFRRIDSAWKKLVIQRGLQSLIK